MALDSRRKLRSYLEIWHSLAVAIIVIHSLGPQLTAVEPIDNSTATAPAWHPKPIRFNSVQPTNASTAIAVSTQLPDSNRIQRLEHQLEDLQRRLTAAEQRATNAVPVSSGSFQASYVQPGQIQPEPECLDCQSEYSLAPSGKVFGSEYPTLQWSGFLQLDTGWVIQDSANSEAIGDIDSKTGLRRVRLRVEGDIRRDSSYLVDLDFAAAGHPSFRDVALRMHEIPGLQNLQFGYFQQPFGMDAMTSGRELLFQERPLPFAFAPFRQTGISTYRTLANKRGTWSASTYWFPTDEFGVFDSGSGGHRLPVG